MHAAVSCIKVGRSLSVARETGRGLIEEEYGDCVARNQRHDAAGEFSLRRLLLRSPFGGTVAFFTRMPFSCNCRAALNARVMMDRPTTPRGLWLVVAVVLAGFLDLLAVPIMAQAPPDAKPAPAVPKAAQKRAKNPLVEVHASFFEIPEAEAVKLGLVGVADTSGPNGEAADGQTEKRSPAVLAVGGVLEPAAAARLREKFRDTKGANLLSDPRVTTRIGQRAVCDIIREFRYPTEFEFDKATKIITPTAFETRNIGVTLEVEPKLDAEGAIDLQLVPQVVKLDGYVRASDGQPVLLRGGRSVGADMMLQDFETVKYPKDTVLQPIFSTNKITTNVTLNSGATVVLGGLRKDRQLEGKQAVSYMLYVLVTARFVDQPDPVRLVLPTAIVKKEDEEGFVRSPFSPEQSPIDARELPSGTELMCPTTKQLFRLP
jgi:hypothetical protein